MRKVFVTVLAMALAAGAAKAQIAFTGASKAVYDEAPAASTGLNHIYVLDSSAGVGMTYTAASAQSPVVWYTYGSGGGAYATQLDGVERNGRETVLRQVKPDCGYIIEEGTQRTYVWVADYSAHALSLESVEAAPASDCGTATLNVAGSGSDLEYYSITGVRKVLDRQLKLAYRSLEWSDDQSKWVEKAEEESYESFKPTMVVPAPLCNTEFTLTGDKFLRFWGREQTVSSSTYATSAVDVRTTAVQETRDNDNERKDDGQTAMGGSAPVKITFSSHCTDAVVYKEWQMATDPDFNSIQLRLNQDEVEQTFEDAGTFYWRFIGSNADGSCSATGETYTVSIGTSELLCPNAFTPGSSEGVNDVWKVSYKSIVQFHCWIFNRWGNKIIELNDPSQGWDGRYRGKLVDTGVYYYVIEASGADGKNYKLKGDINIIRYKQGLNGTTGGTQGN